MEALLAAIPWEDQVITMFGRTVPMPRRIQMFGPHGYRYSGVVHPPRPLLPLLDALRLRIEAATALPFNAVLANLYRDGHDSVGFHRDDDYAHGGQPAVASLSLGAVRRFRLQHRKDRTRSLDLELAAGSLLLIDGEARTEWLHALPRTRLPVGPRINLSYRHMVAR